jgi:hypothetical protein
MARSKTRVKGEYVGRRVGPHAIISELLKGDYSLRKDGTLWGRCPTGDLVRIDSRWKIHIEPNDSITLKPVPPNPNCSIELTGEHGYWHGHLVHGVWKDCR